MVRHAAAATDARAERKERRVRCSPLAGHRIGEVAHLREHRILVYEDSCRHAHQPWPQRVDAAEIQHEVRVAADAMDLVCDWPEPARRMAVEVCPPLCQSVAREHLGREMKSVRRISRGGVGVRVIAGRIIVAVLEEVDVVTQVPQAQYIVKITPCHPADWPADDIAEDEDPQRLRPAHGRCRDPADWSRVDNAALPIVDPLDTRIARSTSEVRTGTASKYSSAAARAARQCTA